MAQQLYDTGPSQSTNLCHQIAIQGIQCDLNKTVSNHVFLCIQRKYHLPSS